MAGDVYPEKNETRILFCNDTMLPPDVPSSEIPCRERPIQRTPSPDPGHGAFVCPMPDTCNDYRQENLSVVG